MTTALGIWYALAILALYALVDRPPAPGAPRPARHARRFQLPRLVLHTYEGGHRAA